MKRVVYLVVATLVTMVVTVLPAAAQGENVQQAQDAVQQAQETMQEAQQYMQSPEGGQALQQSQEKLQEAQNDLVQATQQFEKAREAEMEVTSKSERTTQEGTSKSERTTREGLPPSGGASVGSMLLPVATLLLGSGVLAYAVLRRR